MTAADQAIDTGVLQDRIAKAASALLSRQNADGHWVFELEADATIPAEYILFCHYLGEPANIDLEAKIGFGPGFQRTPSVRAVRRPGDDSIEGRVLLCAPTSVTPRRWT